MILPDDRTDKHLSNELLVRLLDDELTGEEGLFAENHLNGCRVCREHFSELRLASSKFDSFISSLQPVSCIEERQQLAQKLDRAEGKSLEVKGRWNWKRMGWGLAAASLAMGALLLPHWKIATHSPSMAADTFQTASAAFEVNGEAFVALPYSNPDLPLSAPHIVQMQVPVSSLADAGIYVEPVGNRISAPDGAVLADVLLGLDGQPLGIHVLSYD